MQPSLAVNNSPLSKRNDVKKRPANIAMKMAGAVKAKDNAPH